MSRRIDRAFAFLDLCGFTQLMSEEGDECAAGALSDVRSAIRQAAERTAVRVCKWLGDGAMLVAVDRVRLTECLEEIWWWLDAQPTLKIRCGVASGEVLIFEGDDYVGLSVNIAARLCDLAEPGEIVATATGTRGSAGLTQEVQIRGFSSPLRVTRSRGLGAK